MYDKNDKIAEELSNYCTDLREQLSSSKDTINWLSERKRDGETLNEKLAEANKTLGERVKFLESQLSGAQS
jgi:hypothetical protein